MSTIELLNTTVINLLNTYSDGVTLSEIYTLGKLSDKSISSRELSICLQKLIKDDKVVKVNNLFKLNTANSIKKENTNTKTITQRYSIVDPLGDIDKHLPMGYLSKTNQKAKVAYCLYEVKKPLDRNEISELVGINKTAVYAYVRELVEEGYIRKIINQNHGCSFVWSNVYRYPFPNCREHDQEILGIKNKSENEEAVESF